METIHYIQAEPLTRHAFRPFGVLLDAEEMPEGQATSSPIGFLGGRVRIGTAFLPYKGLRLTGMEQHFHVTQAFIPITGSPAVVAVAAPTPQDDPNNVPKPEEIHAFLIDGTVGYMLNKGVWHSDRLPLYKPGSKMVIITDEETSQDLRKHGSMSDPIGQRGGWKLNRIVDFRQRLGVTFEIRL